MADITEAVIITEDSDDELMQRLKAATQHKDPVEKKEPEWNFDIDVTAPIVEEKPAETKASETTEAPAAKETVKTKKITEDAKRGSARVAIGMLELTQKGIFTPLLTRKYRKKFTAEEQERIIQNESKKKKDLTEDDLALSAKFDKLMSRMNRKIDAIPFDDREKKDLEEALYLYFDTKEKTLPPEWFVAMAVTNAIGKRAIDVFTD